MENIFASSLAKAAQTKADKAFLMFTKALEDLESSNSIAQQLTEENNDKMRRLEASNKEMSKLSRINDRMINKISSFIDITDDDDITIDADEIASKEDVSETPNKENS